VWDHNSNSKACVLLTIYLTVLCNINPIDSCHKLTVKSYRWRQFQYAQRQCSYTKRESKQVP
jgi:hypothetical protein